MARRLPSPGSMSCPRFIVAGSTVMITRRTIQRRHLFAHDAVVRDLFLYALGVTANKFGLLLLTVILMSTHEHIVLTDPQGLLPDFLRDFHRLFALGIKRHRKWAGAVWDPGKTSVVRLITSQALVEKIAYCMANPVAAGLVPNVSAWPGLTTHPSQLGRGQFEVPRPRVFFDANNKQWPDSLVLPLAMPPSSLWTGSAEELRQSVSRELELQQEVARKKLESEGRQFLGLERCRRTNPFDQARGPEPLHDRNPTFAVGRGQREMRLAAIAVHRSFMRAYRAALEQWCSGQRDVAFPRGSWWMEHFHAARVSPFAIIA